MVLDLSIVVVTRNDRACIDGCLRSLAHQNEHGFEVIIVDAASTDGTVRAARAAAEHLPFPIRVHASSRCMAVGEARNLGVHMSRTDRVAFLDADAEAHPDWSQRLRAALERNDIVFGRPVHDPTRWTIGAAVRGLRYHFPQRPDGNPFRYASHVSAGYRKRLLQDHPFDPRSQTAEDTLLARRARVMGARARYDPSLVVWHKDSGSVADEFRKSAREGAALGRHVRELGPAVPLIAWACALLVLGLLAASTWNPFLLTTFAVVLWAPALRRAWRQRRHMPPAALAAGVLATPPFDLTLVATYLAGCSVSRRTLPVTSQESPQ